MSAEHSERREIWSATGRDVASLQAQTPTGVCFTNDDKEAADAVAYPPPGPPDPSAPLAAQCRALAMPTLDGRLPYRPRFTFLHHQQP